MKMDENLLKMWIIGLILLSVLFQVASDIVPDVVTAGNSLNGSGIGFGSFFASGGVVFSLMGLGLLLVVVYLFVGKGRK